MDYKDNIEFSADVMLGKPVVKGTRITAGFVLKKLSEGDSPEELIAAYRNLTYTSIRAVFVYASDIIEHG